MAENENPQQVIPGRAGNEAGANAANHAGVGASADAGVGASPVNGAPVPPAQYAHIGGSAPRGASSAQGGFAQAGTQGGFAAQPGTQPGCAQPSPVPPNPAPMADAPKKKSHGWIVAIVVILAVFLFLAISVVSCTGMVASLGVSGAAAVAGADADANSVGVIEIDDTIGYDNSANSPEGLKYLLDQAADNDNIVAVVLRVNSGGGSATAGEEMATYVKQFREETGKPVVVSSAALNASAAYEISSQADYIFVANTTEIGAIGTVMQSTDYSELLGKLGIRVDNIASAESKDSSYGTRPLTDDERTYYQGIVDQINELFIQNVADGRNMSVSDVRKLATGMVFTGKTAVENGLADAIGTREDAIEYAARTAGCLRDYTTCDLSIERSYSLSELTGLLGKSSASDDLAALLKEQSENGNTVR